MADKKYYVLCGSNCKYESMTKEQIIAAIAEATGKTATDVDAAFITKIKEINKGATVQIWFGKTAEYNAIANKRSDVIYIKTDDSALADIENYFTQEINRVSADIAAVNEDLQNTKPVIYYLTWYKNQNNVLGFDDSKQTAAGLIADLSENKNVVIKVKNSGTSIYFDLVALPLAAGIYKLQLLDARGTLTVHCWQFSANGFAYAPVTIADYVVEEGTEDGWTYRKWSSGAAECWFNGAIVFEGQPADTGINNLKLIYKDFAIPFVFVEMPAAIASCNWTSSEWVQAQGYANEKRVRIRLFGSETSITKATTDGHNCAIHISGKYK